MKKTILLCLIVDCMIFINLYGQTKLYMPKEYKQAYGKQTRSENGKPGPYYWQNFVEYSITASIEPKTRLLTGSESITFYNNSQDTLKRVVIKLYQNLYQTGAARNYQLTPETITEGMIITSLKNNDEIISLKPDEKKVNINGTNMIVQLNEPLPPNKNTSFSIDWNFTIPSGTNLRIGTYDSTTFFVGYWYPKIAVYDDINGWDMHNYNAEQEFYSEYANYEVQIKVPAGFGIWATGTLSNANQVLTDKYLKRYKNALVSDSVINIITKDDLSGKKIFESKNGFTTFMYTAEYVTDFAFGVSDHYLWDAASIKNGTGKRILVQSAYNPDSKFFYEVTDIARKTIVLFEEMLPGVPYPYPQMTIFNGDGGMEFPMIVNDGNFNDRVTDIYVTVHEMTHTFFPFYVATNEHKNSWLDEGMAYMLPCDIQFHFEPFDHRPRAARGYSLIAGREIDFPLIIPTSASRGTGFEILTYYKSSVAFEMLSDLLGKEAFKKHLIEFIERWKGKHPTPYDFFNTFNDVSGKDLNWFWRAWYFDQGYPDLAIKDVKQLPNGVEIGIEKAGNMPVPIALELITVDGDTIKEFKSLAVWEDGKREVIIKVKSGKEIESITLGSENIPDNNQVNNRWKR